MTLKKEKTSKKTGARRQPKRLSHTLYSYVEPVNGRYARTFGKRNFGSFSSYIDRLIAADRQTHFAEKYWAKKGWKRPEAKDAETPQAA